MRGKSDNSGPRYAFPSWATRSSSSACGSPWARAHLPGSSWPSTDLAGRPVVLKISDIEGSEPQTLAQLLHTNIVPIFRSPRTSARSCGRLHALPRRGEPLGGPVALRADTPSPTSGDRVVHSLEALPSPRPDSLAEASGGRGESGPPRERLTGPVPGARPSSIQADRATPLAALRAMSYEHATAWVVASSREGLYYSPSASCATTQAVACS